MISRLLPAFIVAGAALTACAPTTQEVHLGRIERRIAEQEPDPQEAEVALEAAVSTPHLEHARLVRAVLSRNPTLKAARAGWRAAAARYHEKDALPDPVLSYSFGPGSIFDSSVRYGQIIKLSQTIPWVGKMGSRGDVELFRAEMRAEDYASARIELALRTCRLFDRLYVVARSLEINEGEADLVGKLAKSIEAQYAVGKGTLYDPLQAQVMRTHLMHEHTVLETEQRIVKAQLNALLHRSPEAKLPPAPKRLSEHGDSIGQKAAEELALKERPELRRSDAERKGIEASIDVAQRDYAPDFTLFGSYNSMWASPSHQIMVGISAPLPVVVDRRAGAESAARALLSENDSQQEALSDQIRAEVYEARLRLLEAKHVAKLYTERLVPLTKKQTQAVRPAYASGDASFFEVLAAERALWAVHREWHEALALVHTRGAELQRAMGQVPGLGDEGGDR